MPKITENDEEKKQREKKQEKKSWLDNFLQSI
jgi:hypothetical protein